MALSVFGPILSYPSGSDGTPLWFSLFECRDNYFALWLGVLGTSLCRSTALSGTNQPEAQATRNEQLQSMAGWSSGVGQQFVSDEFIVAPQSYHRLPRPPLPTEHPDLDEFTQIDCDVFSRWAGEVVPLQMRLGDCTLASARILVGAVCQLLSFYF